MSEQFPKIRVRPKTFRAAQRVKRIKGWTFTEAVDRAFRALEQIDPELQGDSARRRKTEPALS